MKNIRTAILASVALLGLSATNSPAAHNDTNSPVIIVLLAGDDESPCTCKAGTSSAAGSVKLWQCPNGTNNWAQIKVSSPTTPVSPACNADCKTSPNKCTAAIKAELVIPAGCLSSPGSVTGPGLGTTGDPCVDVVNGGTYTSNWNLTAPCNSVPNPSSGAWMEFRLSACGAAQDDPVLKYAPTLNCDKCSQ